MTSIEEFEALFSTPGYDGEDLDLGIDPDDPGVWVIWGHGRIKAGHDLSAARAARAWQAIRDAGGRPECGDGMFGNPVKPRTVETITVAPQWGHAL